MPNPFDQFDSKAEANPFDQFDAQEPKKKKVSAETLIDEVGRKAVLDFPDNFTEGARGLGAVAINSIAPTLAPIPAGLQYLNEKVKGNNPNFESLFANAMDSMSYHPESEVAKGITDRAGKFANDILIPAATGVQGLPYVNTLGPVLGAIGRNLSKPAKPKAAVRAESESKTAALRAEKQAAMEQVAQKESQAALPKGQVEMFPESLADPTGQASPYDAGVMGTSSPVTPKRARAQQELPFGSRKPTINIDEAGVSLRPEDLPWVERNKTGALAKLDEEARLAGNEEFLNAKQQEMWATDHPGDLAQAGEMAAREIPPELTKQDEMFGPNFALEHDGQMPLFKDEPTTALKDQADLFPPQTNMHRSFTDLRVDDGKGGERPLTRAEFIKTHEALAMEPGTKHVLPKDMEIAFKDYLEQVNGKQQDMFDVGSRTDSWKQETAQKTYEQSIPEMVDNHPSVVAAEKRAQKHSEFLTKMHMAKETSASKLARAMKDLAFAEEQAAKARANVEAGLRANTSKKPDGITYLNSGIPLKLSEEQLKATEFFKGNRGLEDMVPEHTTVAATPEGVVQKAMEASDVADRGIVGKTAGLFTKGFLYEKLKTNNPIVKYTYDKISEAVDTSKNKVRTLLQDDFLPKIRELSNTDMIELHQAMHDAMMNKYELSASDLAKHGFTEKQIATWESLQRGYDESFNAINTALEKAGHKPIQKYTAYMAGMSTGDFRTAIVKKVDGKEPVFVGFVGSNVKWMRDLRVKNFLKEHPEYSVGPESFHGRGMASRGDKGATMVEALQLLAEQSPDMDMFAKQLGDHLTGDAYNYMNAKTHTMQKKGVFGMEGSKQWVTGWQSLLPLSAEQRKAVIAKQNALDGFRAQVRYIETMAEWSEMSKTMDDLKQVFSDPAIQDRQKNAIAMSKEYVQNAMGNNPSKIGKAMDSVASSVGESLGVGPSILGAGVRGAKGAINTIFFGLNPQFLATNLVQGFIMTPTAVNLLRSRGFDVARIDKMGAKEYMKATMAGFDKYRGANQDAFSNAMWKYGHDHGISSTQIFEHSTDIRKGASHAFSSVMEAGLGKAEGLPRSTVYSMISNILRESGYGSHPDIFKVARELTDMVMVDYRPHESQRINNVFGPAAPLLRNLSSYAGNANSFAANLVREAGKTKNGSAILAATMTGLVVHGLMGFPGFAEADKLVEEISTAMGKPTTLTNEVMKVASKHGDAGDLISLGFGSALGLDLHQTLGRSSILPSQLGGGGASKVVDIAKAAGTAAMSPTEMNSKRLAYEVSPKILRNQQDLTWFSQGDMAMNKKQGYATQGMYRRTEEDKRIHRMGATSVNEFKNKENMRQQTLQDMNLREKQTSVLNKLGDKQVSSSGLEAGDVQKALDKYIALEGNPETFVTKLVEMKVGMTTTMMERYLLQKAQAGDVSAAKALQRMREKVSEE